MNGKLLAFRAQDGTTYFQHANWLGTVRARTNYLGQVAATASSLPYGDNLVQGGSTYSDQDNQEYAGWGGDGRERSRWRAMPGLATMKPSRRWGTQMWAIRRLFVAISLLP